jgi:prepilin-type N-terminal cleavage/methylation domain-containing protein
MTTMRTTSRQAGFTLIETMIALFFLSFIVGEVAMITGYAARSANLARRVARANALADEAVEKTRNKVYDNAQLAVTYQDPENCPAPGGAPNPANTVAETCAAVTNGVACTSTPSPRNCSSHGVSFTRVRTVTPLPLGTAITASNQADVDVVVTYTDIRGAAQTIRISSVITRY